MFCTVVTEPTEPVEAEPVAEAVTEAAGVDMVTEPTEPVAEAKPEIIAVTGSPVCTVTLPT